MPVLIEFGAASQAIGAKTKFFNFNAGLAYASIEQNSTSAKQGPWTDIYALGVICYRAITGETPIEATGRIRRDPLVPLMSRDIPSKLGYPEHVIKAIDKALSVFWEDRPQSIAEWQDMLEGRVDAGRVASDTVDQVEKSQDPTRENNYRKPLRKKIGTTANYTNRTISKPSKGFIFSTLTAVAVTALTIGLILN